MEISPWELVVNACGEREGEPRLLIPMAARVWMMDDTKVITMVPVGERLVLGVTLAEKTLLHLLELLRKEREGDSL